MTGVTKAMAFLESERIQKFKEANRAIHQEGFRIEGEVKDSIAGRKAEPTSVDTGQFLNSVSTDNSRELESVVFSDVEHAKFLEHGTSKINARRHFGNTLKRESTRIQTVVELGLK